MNVSHALILGLATLTAAAACGAWHVFAALRDWFYIAHGVELVAFAIVLAGLIYGVLYCAVLIACLWAFALGAL